ncbi:MAG: UDP-N-acetylmuramate--L-alanine ligase [Candidatus Parcubacteria bacterium]|nr:UDP-N-acetylmuramate--L-alanine ligase [Candidatus Parcubacteria bacterium]
MVKKVYLIGIGGMGMASLALLAKEKNWQISGSDLKESENTKQLQKKGIKVHIGHDPKNIIDFKPDLVVYSSAIKDDNLEKAYALKTGLTLKGRFAFLSDLIFPHMTVAVAGTHGKTSTTAMIGYIRQKAGLPVYTYLGGQDDCLKNKKIKKETAIILETDESDRSFLLFDPDVAVITNIDKDHLNNYDNSFLKLKKAFFEFIKGKGRRIWNVICIDDLNLKEISKNFKNILTYSVKNQADLEAKNILYNSKGTQADIYYHNKKRGVLIWPILGEKNLSNALGAILASMLTGVTIEKSISILKNFKLPDRRLEIKGNFKKAIVIDDHADHTTEIKATLEALKVLNRRLIAIYQPHRYSRMKCLKKSIGKAFKSADMIITVDLCSAGEKSIKGVSGKAIFQWIKKTNSGKNVFYIKDWKNVPKFLSKKIKPKDCIVILGPGTISGLSDLLIKN